MAGHMVRAESAGKLRIPQNSHNLEKIHIAFIGVDLQEIMKPSSDVPHVDLVDFAPLTQVLDNGKIWGMHLTPEAPRSSIRALEDYSRTLGSFKSASPSGFKVNRCRPPAGRNERRL